MRKPGKHPVDDLSQEELKKMSDMATELRENPLKGWKGFFRSVIQPFQKRDSIDATYMTFKPIFDIAKMPFTKKDAEHVRANMLRLAEKLDEVHKQQVDEIDAELEQKND